MRKAFAMACLIAALTLCAAAQVVAEQQLILRHVNVVDTRDGALHRNARVVIAHGVIQSVSGDGSAKPDEGALAIDASGKYLIPGLWDMHAHTALAPVWDENILYPLYVANGITGVRDMGGDPDLLEKRRDRINHGEVLGPHLIYPGPFLVHGKNSAETIGVNNPEDARQAVDALKKRGVDFIKILDGLSRESYFAVSEESAKQKISFVGHVPYAVSLPEASSAGQRSVEHLFGAGLAGSSKETELREQFVAAVQKRDYAAQVSLRDQVVSSYDRAKAHALFLLLRKNQTWQVPTLIWTKTMANLDAPDLTSDPRLEYVPKSIRATWDPPKLLQNTSAAELKVEKAELVRDFEIVKTMQADGVPLLAGSDGPDPFVIPAFSLYDELELLVKSGLTPLQALQDATLNPAKFLRKEQAYGTVESGHVADLVLLDANPLDDIRNTRHIAGVVLGGKFFSRADLDKRLSDIRDMAASH